MNIKVDVQESEEGPGYGGAILAAVACGEYGSVQEAAKKLVKVVDTVEPDPEPGSEIRGPLRAVQTDLSGGESAVSETEIRGDPGGDSSIKSRIQEVYEHENRGSDGSFFREVRRIIEDLDTAELVNAMEKTPLPRMWCMSLRRHRWRSSPFFRY